MIQQFEAYCHCPAKQSAELPVRAMGGNTARRFDRADEELFNRWTCLRKATCDRGLQVLGRRTSDDARQDGWVEVWPVLTCSLR